MATGRIVGMKVEMGCAVLVGGSEVEVGRAGVLVACAIKVAGINVGGSSVFVGTTGIGVNVGNTMRVAVETWTSVGRVVTVGGIGVWMGKMGGNVGGGSMTIDVPVDWAELVGDTGVLMGSDVDVGIIPIEVAVSNGDVVENGVAVATTAVFVGAIGVSVGKTTATVSVGGTGDSCASWVTVGAMGVAEGSSDVAVASTVAVTLPAVGSGVDEVSTVGVRRASSVKTSDVAMISEVAETVAVGVTTLPPGGVDVGKGLVNGWVGVASGLTRMLMGVGVASGLRLSGLGGNVRTRSGVGTINVLILSGSTSPLTSSASGSSQVPSKLLAGSL